MENFNHLPIVSEFSLAKVFDITMNNMAGYVPVTDQYIGLFHIWMNTILQNSGLYIQYTYLPLVVLGGIQKEANILV